MKKIFITYGDKNYHDSLQRIKKEAESLNYFDEIRLYNDETLPALFKKYTELYNRGGGYWMWKPYIVHDTLSRMNEGDIVVYADAGCTLLKHKDWEYYFQMLRKKDAIFFISKGKNKKWCKKDVFIHFNPKNSWWRNANQIQATFFIIKKTKDNDVIERWYQLAAEKPNLFIDIKDKERPFENKVFKEHRHDQAVLTGCICMSDKLHRYYLLPEKMEKRLHNGQAVLASRISTHNVRGANTSSPAENSIITFINRFTEYPMRKLRTLFFFYLSHRNTQKRVLTENKSTLKHKRFYTDSNIQNS